jgi:hypothetical protein
MKKMKTMNLSLYPAAVLPDPLREYGASQTWARRGRPFLFVHEPYGFGVAHGEVDIDGLGYD